MDDALSAALAHLAAGERLSAAVAEGAVAALLDGLAGEDEAAELLTALAQGGETADELEGAVRAVRARMIPFRTTGDRPAIDTCGTGGDRSGTLNLSTGAAVIVCACGARVIKHGNRAASSRSGSTDVLEALGVAIAVDHDRSRRCLDELGITYLHAPAFHPGLAMVAPVRRRLPFRTLLNLVGPLANPASPRFQVVGCPDPDRATLMAGVLARLGHIERALVVTGEDGLDEVTLAGQTQALLIERGSITPMTLGPGDFGLPRTSAQTIQVENALESAARLRLAFQGERGPARDYLVANAATALWTMGTHTLMEGARAAEAALDQGAVARLVERWALLCPATREAQA